MTAFGRMRERVLIRLLGRSHATPGGNRRIRLAGLSMGMNAVSKGFGFFALIYSTKVAIENLGVELFGVWAVISSISVLLGFLDLGVSNALIGRVAGSDDARTSGASTAKVVTYGLLLLVALGVTVGIVLCAIVAIVPMEVILRGLSVEAQHDALVASCVFALLFGLSLPAQGMCKVVIGVQLGWIVHAASCVGWLIALVMISFAPQLSAPLWYYVLALFGVQQLAALLLLPLLLQRGLLMWPGRIAEIFSAVRGDVLFSRGRAFFLIQVAFAVVWGSNQLIVSTIVGPIGAAEFGILQRVFMIVQAAVVIANSSLWAAYADATVHGDREFIRAMLKRSIIVTAVGAALGACVIAGGINPLINLIADGSIVVSSASVALMAAWTVLEAIGISYSMYLNGTGIVAPQAMTGVLHVILGIPLKVGAIILFGLPGLLGGMIASYLLFTVLPLATFYRTECSRPLRAS